MKNKIITFTLICVVIIVTSCKQMYIPNMQNVVLSKKKGEAKLMLNPNNYQASYTITNHIGVIANGFNRENEWTGSINSSDTKFASTMLIGEIGMGFYSALDENAVIEIYTGIGYGSITFDEENSDGISTSVNTLSANIIKRFIQPSIGISQESLEFAFTPKFTAIHFDNIKSSGYTVYDLEDANIAEIDMTTYLFLEPGITLRYGAPAVKAHAQFAYSYKFNNEPLNHKKFILNFGVHININNTIKLIKGEE